MIPTQDQDELIFGDSVYQNIVDASEFDVMIFAIQNAHKFSVE